MSEPSGHDVAFEARRLARAARSGTLGTTNDGAPFVSLVTPAIAADGSVLLLLSDLSEHTRHLRADSRCAVMMAGEAQGPNPQTTPRLTVTGMAIIDQDPALKAQWVNTHPYAAFYADFGDFNLWRVMPATGLLVAGFARAHRLTATDLVPLPAAQAAVAAAEAGIIGHCNADHGDTLVLIANSAGYNGPEWRMIACDTDGFDLANGERSVRLHWPSPVDSAGSVRSALVHLAGAARKRAITTAGPGQFSTL